MSAAKMSFTLEMLRYWHLPKVELTESSQSKIAMCPQVPLSWEECGCMVKQLQAAAHSLHNHSAGSKNLRGSDLQSRKLLQAILSCLQEFRESIDAAYLQNNDDNQSQDEALFERAQMDRIVEVLVASQICSGCTIPTIEDIQQQRGAAIEDEIAAVTQINAALSSQNLPAMSSVDQERLITLISKLRHQEQQLEFHRGLLRAQQESSGPAGVYSMENFAYGSTPFPTWLHLFTQDVLRETISCFPGQSLMVFGSSTGSLAFFGALCLGLSCVGVEILPFLHDVAEQTRNELQISEERCRFVCADMLTVSVQNPSIVLLTSQCWDDCLYQQVRQKLEVELQAGALVIDYKDDLKFSDRFQMVQQLKQQQVSWTNVQSLFIFKC